MNPKPRTAAEIVAASEHKIRGRRTSVHVIVCHDLDHRSHALHDVFSFANRVSPAALDALTHDLANDIISDAALLIRDLEAIKAFAERCLAKLPTAQPE